MLEDDITTKFYKVMGIEPKHEDCCSMADKYWANEELAEEYITFDKYMTKVCPEQNKVCYGTCEYAYWSEIYPPITDHILLELVCVLNKYYKEDACYYELLAEDIKTLKEEVLEDCIDYADDIKSDVRKLFEE